MQIEPIFINFIGLESIELANKQKLIQWTKSTVNENCNQSGYTSYTTGFINKDEPVVQELTLKVEQGFNELHASVGLSSRYKQQIKHFWANDGTVNPDIVAPHNHTEGCFSAVYWPVADENSAPLTFINPNNQVSYIFNKELVEIQNEINSTLLHFPPQEDLCIFFPSWLWHYVAYDGDSSNQRISYAFNSEAILK